MYFLVAAIFVVISSYVFLILVVRGGWLRARRQNTPIAEEDIMISVIIPVRNEASSIGALLKQLAKVNYTSFEVIVVDDHSEDQTAEIVLSTEVSEPSIQNPESRINRVRLIENSGTGKKSAITTGVNHAKGSVIVTTDGDCEINPDWLKSMNAYFQDPETKMVFGGVSILADTFFGHVQAIEFSSLIGSGISLWALKHPVMCNGANLGFRKVVFEEVGGYSGNDHIASGDDEFLMRKILSHYSDGVAFMNNEEGNVRTKPAPGVSAFFQQRLRWAGKWRHNTSTFSKILALYILVVQLAIIGAFTILVIRPNEISIAVAVVLLVMRLIAEAVLLIPVCRFLKVRWHWGAFLFLQFMYPFYIVGTGLFSNLTAVKWKDRKI